MDDLAIEYALRPPVWTEGWHTGFVVDHVTTFGVHASEFKLIFSRTGPLSIAIPR